MRLQTSNNFEIEVYKVKDRINQPFLRVLLIDEQMRQTILIRNDIKTGIRKTAAVLNNGSGLTDSKNISL